MSLSRRPALIVIQGVPGAGKTTLARRLAKDTGLPQIGKDDLKEFFFDKLGTGDRDWSRMLGKAVSQMLYPLTDTILESGHDFILESAFHRAFAAEELRAIVAKYDVRCLEIYCHLKHEERRRRFIQRNENGERHQGHIDAFNYKDLDGTGDLETYGPLGISELHKVDTTHFGEQEYQMLLREVMQFINE